MRTLENMPLPDSSQRTNRPSAATERLADVLDQFRESAGAPIRNHQELPVFDNNLLSDSLRLNRYWLAVAHTR